MLLSRIIKLITPQSIFLVPIASIRFPNQKKLCPSTKSIGGRCGAGENKIIKKGPVCPGTPSTPVIPVCPGSPSSPGRPLSPNSHDSGDGGIGGGLKRALIPGKCRMGFIPEEWFVFFKPMTGVTGPYFLMLGLGNYLVSKEIFVMEHEYYLGISEAIMVYYVTTKFGPTIGALLDKEVDAIANELEQGRKDKIGSHETNIKQAEMAIWRADGQKELIDAKKINIATQLEAIYRERLMMVHQRVRGRMDYHVRRQKIENRIHQKWMIDWVLQNVRNSITPEFKRAAMAKALLDLEALASRSQT